MDYTLPAELEDFLTRLDAFIETEIDPLAPGGVVANGAGDSSTWTAPRPSPGHGGVGTPMRPRCWARTTASSWVVTPSLACSVLM